MDYVFIVCLEFKVVQQNIWQGLFSLVWPNTFLWRRGEGKRSLSVKKGLCRVLLHYLFLSMFESFLPWEDRLEGL